MNNLLKTKEPIFEHDLIRLFSQAPAPIALYRGRELRHIFANKAYVELFNREVIGKTVHEVFPEKDGEQFIDFLQRVYDTGIPYEGKELPAIIHSHNSQNPEKKYYNVLFTPYREAAGEVQGVMAFGHDVTQLVLARQEIEYAEENARLAIDSADLGTYEINLVTNEMFVSPRFRQIWGIAQETTARSDYASVIHPDDLAARARAHKKSVETGFLQYEARIIHPGNIVRWIKVRGKLLYDRQGAPVRLLGMIQDISEQKLFAEELSKKVDERTKELQQINNELAHTNEQLEQFAYIASHDLQEPLRKIQIFNSFLKDEPGLSEKGAYFVEKIGSSALRMTGLIKDLLEYSRLSQHKKYFEQTNLNVVVQRIRNDFELLIVQKQAVLYTDPLPVLDAIPLQMNQLFFNLVGNALKFTREGVTPVIKITCDSVSAGRLKKFAGLDQSVSYCEIRVADNGIGFNQDYASKIFTIFQRLNPEKVYGGFGIGLALCHKIISNHNGVIYAEGRPGEGAVIGFLIPLHQHTHPT